MAKTKYMIVSGFLGAGKTTGMLAGTFQCGGHTQQLFL